MFCNHPWSQRHILPFYTFSDTLAFLGCPNSVPGSKQGSMCVPLMRAPYTQVHSQGPLLGREETVLFKMQRHGGLCQSSWAVPWAGLEISRTKGSFSVLYQSLAAIAWKFSEQNSLWASRKEQIWSNTHSASLVQCRSVSKRAQLASLRVCLGAGWLAGFRPGQETPPQPRAPINKSSSSCSAGEESGGLNCIQIAGEMLTQSADLSSLQG